MAPNRETTWPLVTVVAWVVLAVMALALGYTGWIAIVNFDRIGV